MIAEAIQTDEASEELPLPLICTKVECTHQKAAGLSVSGLCNHLPNNLSTGRMEVSWNSALAAVIRGYKPRQTSGSP